MFHFQPSSVEIDVVPVESKQLASPLAYVCRQSRPVHCAIWLMVATVAFLVSPRWLVFQSFSLFDARISPRAQRIGGVPCASGEGGQFDALDGAPGLWAVISPVLYKPIDRLLIALTSESPRDPTEMTASSSASRSLYQIYKYWAVTIRMNEILETLPVVGPRWPAPEH